MADDRDESGKFVKGCKPGPGRPRNIDFRKAAEQRAEELGVDLGKEIGSLAISLLAQAQKGDIQAAKLLIERLCGMVPNKQEVEFTGDRPVIVVPERPGSSPAEVDAWAERNRIGNVSEN